MTAAFQSVCLGSSLFLWLHLADSSRPCVSTWVANRGGEWKHSNTPWTCVCDYLLLSTWILFKPSDLYWFGWGRELSVLGHFNVCVCVFVSGIQSCMKGCGFFTVLSCVANCAVCYSFTHTHKHFAVLRIQDHTLGIHFITFTGLVYIFTHDLSPWLSPLLTFSITVTLRLVRSSWVCRQALLRHRRATAQLDVI